MRPLVVFVFLLLIKAFSRIFYRIDLSWVEKPDDPWSNIRLVALLHHTSLFEVIYLAVVPNALLWKIARRGVVPGADTTIARPIVGRIFKYFCYKMIPVSRRRDATWDKFLGEIDDEALVVIAPEGRMMRPTGLDKDGKPMTVRGGIADILEALPDGRLLLAYSGGLHHVQVPGALPRLFKTARLRLEVLGIDDYRRDIRGRMREGESFRAAVVRDLEARRDRWCPVSKEADAP